MAVTCNFYGLGMEDIVTGGVDLDTDTFYAALTTSSYAQNQDTDHYFSVVTNEITGTGYTAGGVALTSLAVSYDATSNEVRWDCADIQWTSASFTARKLVVYKHTGTSSTSNLILWMDFGADETVASGTFTVQISATGIGKITVS